MKPIAFLGDSLERIRAFPVAARRVVGYQLDKVQRGLRPDDFKPLPRVGKGVEEIRIRDATGRHVTDEVTGVSTKRYNSVWDALEESDEAAANMKVRAELMIALQKRVKKELGTHAVKAATLGISQPRLNDLLRGRIDKFSLDALVNLASRAGLRVDVKIRRAA